jgi:hypothetical protein
MIKRDPYEIPKCLAKRNERYEEMMGSSSRHYGDNEQEKLKKELKKPLIQLKRN